MHKKGGPDRPFLDFLGGGPKGGFSENQAILIKKGVKIAKNRKKWPFFGFLGVPKGVLPPFFRVFYRFFNPQSFCLSRLRVGIGVQKGPKTPKNDKNCIFFTFLRGIKSKIVFPGFIEKPKKDPKKPLKNP